ncbi:hypothetical protein AALA99_12105 [Anaerotruncus colihominis]|uniref:hypothetical protein n=1 Tax=Anaerotruncus colihominis TaxID=169435 RepID=UPI003517657C
MERIYFFMKRMPAFLAILSGSWFLTSLIDRRTLSTQLQFALVFLYFVAVGLLILYGYERYILKHQIEKKGVVKWALPMAALMAACIIGANIDWVLDPYRQSQIIIAPHSANTEYQESESVWISNIFIDGESVSLADYPVPEGWRYHSEWDDILSISPEPLPLTLNFPYAKDIKIRFAYYNSFADTAEIQDGEYLRQMELISDEEGGYIYQVTGNKYTLTNVQKSIKLFIAEAMFSGLIYGVISLLIYSKRRKNLLFMVALLFALLKLWETAMILVIFALFFQEDDLNKKLVRGTDHSGKWHINLTKSESTKLILSIAWIFIDFYIFFPLETIDLPLKPYSFLVFCFLLFLGVISLQVLLFHIINNIWTSILLMNVIVFSVLISVEMQVQLRYHVFLGCSTIAYYYLFEKKAVYLKGYINKKFICAFFIFTSTYTAFAFWGFDLFLQGDFIDLSPKKIWSFINITIFMAGILWFLINKFESVIQKRNLTRLPDKKQILQFRIKVFILIAVILTMFCIIFYPANLTPDGVDQWMQARGYSPLIISHPPIHTLLIRLCSMIYPSLISVTIAQSLLFAYALALHLSLAYRKGCDKKILYGLAIGVSVLPNTIAMITLVSKNVIFAIAMLLLIYFLFELFEDVEGFCKKPIIIIQFIIIVAFLQTVRNNSFVIIPLLIGISLYLTIKHFKVIKCKLIICNVCMILLANFITGSFYNYFGVSGSVNLPSSQITTPFIVALKFNIELPQDTIDYLESMLPLEEYIKRYDPYNSDTLTFTKPRMDLSNFKASEGLKHYLKFLLNRPDIVIKSRLDAVNLIWDVFSHPGVRHDRYAFGIWFPKALEKYCDIEERVFLSSRKVDDHYGIGDGLAKILVKYIGYFNDKPLLNSIFWRNGIYVILMMLSLLISLQKKRYYILMIIMVPFIVLCTLVLGMGYQIYQYLWYFPLCIVSIVGYLLLTIECPNYQK